MNCSSWLLEEKVSKVTFRDPADALIPIFHANLLKGHLIIKLIYFHFIVILKPFGKRSLP